MKAKKIKARKMWGVGKGVFAYKSNANETAKKWNSKVTPLAVLSTDDESIESMVKQMSEMIFCTDKTDDRSVNRFQDLSGSWQEHYRTNARASLAAIGIHSRAPKS